MKDALATILAWFRGRTYFLRYQFPSGGSEPMQSIRLRECPRVGDYLQTFYDHRGSLQWKVVEVEHLEGNCPTIVVVDRFGRDLWKRELDSKNGF